MALLNQHCRQKEMKYHINRNVSDNLNLAIWQILAKIAKLKKLQFF